MEEKVIKVEHLTKQYRLYEQKSDRLKEALSITKKSYHTPFYALKGITFDVNKGETLGVIGTNGSGKSTLLKILTGVVNPTGGEVYVNGRISALLELGAGFNMEYTGLQNIDLQGVMMGISADEMEKKKAEILAFADIGDYINQPVKTYSSGMFARLAFAVAISVEPEILIVDEALSVGDVFFQSKCFRKFDELREKGVSILFVSHDIVSVRKMCNRVLWIEQGVQRMFGNCNEVCTAYFNAQMKRMNEENANYITGLQIEQAELEKTEFLEMAIPQITPAKNSMLSDKVKILSVFVKDREGNFVENMFSDETYMIGIVTEYYECMEDVIVGFTMSNAKGIAILASNTYAESGKNFSVKKGELVYTSFSFTAPGLHTGQYEISPAVALGIQENHVNLTWLHGVASIQFEREGHEISEFGIPYSVRNNKIERIKFL